MQYLLPHSADLGYQWLHRVLKLTRRQLKDSTRVGEVRIRECDKLDRCSAINSRLFVAREIADYKSARTRRNTRAVL